MTKYTISQQQVALPNPLKEASSRADKDIVNLTSSKDTTLDALTPDLLAQSLSVVNVYHNNFISVMRRGHTERHHTTGYLFANIDKIFHPNR